MKIVLASGSPRRRELLSLITENFAVCPADADESLRDGAPLADEVVRLSRLKAEAAMQSHPDAVCIGSDTMVTICRSASRRTERTRRICCAACAAARTRC